MCDPKGNGERLGKRKIREKNNKFNRFPLPHLDLEYQSLFLLISNFLVLFKFLAAEETPEEPPPVTDSATLKHFAREAEVL